MEAVAKTKYLKGSPQKARLVIDLVRGKNVSKALAILQYTNKRAAGPIAKCLRSAIANATFKAEQQNIAIDPDDLWVKRCFVDMGPTKNRRRLRPAPQGRAYFERRHYCHITIELTSDPIEDPADAFDPSKKKPIKASNKKADTAKPVEKKAKAEKVETADKPEEKKAEASVKEEAPVEEVKTEAAAETVTESAEAPEAVEKSGETAEETVVEEKKENAVEEPAKEEVKDQPAAEADTAKDAETEDTVSEEPEVKE